jgi:hypothetical protein
MKHPIHSANGKRRPKTGMISKGRHVHTMPIVERRLVVSNVKATSGSALWVIIFHWAWFEFNMKRRWFPTCFEVFPARNPIHRNEFSKVCLEFMEKSLM